MQIASPRGPASLSDITTGPVLNGHVLISRSPFCELGNPAKHEASHRRPDERLGRGIRLSLGGWIDRSPIMAGLDVGFLGYGHAEQEVAFRSSVDSRSLSRSSGPIGGFLPPSFSTRCPTGPTASWPRPTSGRTSSWPTHSWPTHALRAKFDSWARGRRSAAPIRSGHGPTVPEATTRPVDYGAISRL